MAERAEALAAKFEAAKNELIATVEGVSGEQWAANCEDEGWSVAVVAHHIAAGTPLISGLVQAMASGADLPGLAPEQLDQSNAQHAEQFAKTTKEETLEILRSGGAAAAAALRSMSDDQLDLTALLFAGNPKMSTEQVIENVLIGSVTGHHASIKKSI